ncbi:hypothetical protein LTR53_001821 [Teratosphaeriaceae sp. CCFEE 6253]|nr:hypothetical protein LTR53_001821 [Teratosphaeriaceae sp. CCFEE 6253]
MAAHRIGLSDHQAQALEERVNHFAGEDGSSDFDDLDMVPRKKHDVSFDEYLDSIGEGVVSVSSGTDSSAAKKRKQGERIVFDSDEDADDVYGKFKKRKGEARKKAAASTRRARASVKNASLVGRKPKTVIPHKEGKRKEQAYGEQDDDDMLMEDTLPDYLRQRRGTFEDQREKLRGTAGLQLPPEYDGVDFSDDERMEHLAERPVLSKEWLQREYGDVDLPKSGGIVPAPIAQYLRPYQIKGVEFLHELFVFQQGGILGDDMGLGKTIQIIAFLTAAFGKTGDERDGKRMRKIRRMGEDEWYPRILIVCPGSLMANWQSELDRWGWWHTYVYHGNSTDKAAALAAAANGRLEIMITTYESYRIGQSAINGIRWDAVVADECHKIKEPKAAITQAMTNINALCRIGLSGTAIQNKYEELWTLLNWTNPGKFGPISTWKHSICIPLKLGQSHDSTLSQLAKARRTAEKLVKNLLPKFFLRRTKALIADQLPKKSDRVVFCPMTETQEEAYNNFCDSEIVRAIRDSSDPCPCGSGKKQGWCCFALIDGHGKWQHYVFPAMQTLSKMANHLALLIPSGESDKERHDKDVEILEVALPSLWKDLYRQRDSIVNYANQDFCGKWRVLKKLLKLWHSNGDKVLVFSHSVRLLRMLNLLFKATTAYNVSYLDGSLSYADRAAAVDEYNSDAGQFVFLISTRAGGVGLNITSANKVVVVDPNWNPAYDLQAQDRAYRIGQTRDVEVFRLVSKGTIEEIVYARQIYKQQQANIGYNASVERRYFKGVQDQKEMKGEIFGLKNLFAPMSENVVLREIVNQTNVAEMRAGVEIAGLDLEASQEDEERGLAADEGANAAMSQLAAEVIDDPASRRRTAALTAKKRDPVSAILASVGVEYTHENSEVVGTSKIETKISSRAQKAGNDLDYDQDRAFGAPASQGQHATASQPAGYVYGKHDHATAAASGAGEQDVEGRVRYKYHPPEEVRRRQFCTMANGSGYEDVTEFALVVEGWTQGQRRECLEKFYLERRAALGG